MLRSIVVRRVAAPFPVMVILAIAILFPSSSVRPSLGSRSLRHHHRSFRSGSSQCEGNHHEHGDRCNARRYDGCGWVFLGPQPVAGPLRSHGFGPRILHN